MKEFFDMLFDSGEGYCTGTAKAKSVNLYPKSGEFFCINPLHLSRDYAWFKDPDKYDEGSPRRADLNVTTFRNFMFEMDGVPLDIQHEVFTRSIIPFTAVTYSGGKSLHAILSVDRGACDGVHTQLGLDTYKTLWNRLAAQLNLETKKLYTGESGSDYIDASCKNPSRLSRYPYFKAAGREEQTLFYLTNRVSKLEFDCIIEECPVVYAIKQNTFNPPEFEVDNVKDFEAAASSALLRKLKIVTWADSQSMYPELYKLSLWAIDETNVTYEAFSEFLNKYTYKFLISEGYPSYKLDIGVKHAFKEKKRL